MAVTKSKYISGFCNDIGKPPQHEGTKPVSASGAPMATCTAWESCGCQCHKQITEMYKLAGMDRQVPEQSVEYLKRIHAERSSFSLPDDVAALVDAALSTPGGPSGHPDIEDPSTGHRDAATGTPAAPAQPVFTPTPTGRRARGQLEYDVLKVCQDFVGDVYDWTICTPKLVAEQIGKMNATEPPSTGAINAVWDRWEKLDFAVQDKKPSRFVRFTGNSSGAALDLLKARAKRAKKRGEAELKRGSLRPKRR